MRKTTRVKKAAARKPKTLKAAKRAAADTKAVRRDYIPIFNSQGKEVEKFQIDRKIFTGEVKRGAIYDAVRMYNANRRQGNASTKTRGDVSGGGKKPWRQKGTGRARAGSTRSPLWRHGGVVFGPHPRDYHYWIPKKIKVIALMSILNAKLNDNKVIGIDSMVIDTPKTKKFKSIIDALKLKGKSLFVLDRIDENVKRSSRNLSDVVIRNCADFNTMDILESDNVVMSKAALVKMPERFKNI